MICQYLLYMRRCYTAHHEQFEPLANLFVNLFDFSFYYCSAPRNISSKLPEPSYNDITFHHGFLSKSLIAPFAPSSVLSSTFALHTCLQWFSSTRRSCHGLTQSFSSRRTRHQYSAKGAPLSPTHAVNVGARYNTCNRQTLVFKLLSQIHDKQAQAAQSLAPNLAQSSTDDNPVSTTIAEYDHDIEHIGEVFTVKSVRFVLLSKIAEGSDGVVYKVRLCDNRGGFAALKVLKKPTDREAEQLKKLAIRGGNRNVVEYIASERSDHGEMHILMEYIDGECLGKRELSASQSAELSDALEYLKSCDVQSWGSENMRYNIMIEKHTERPVLIDFGTTLYPVTNERTHHQKYVEKIHIGTNNTHTHTVVPLPFPSLPESCHSYANAIFLPRLSIIPHNIAITITESRLHPASHPHPRQESTTSHREARPVLPQAKQPISAGLK